MLFLKSQAACAGILLLTARCVLAQQIVWGQCGGNSWTGPTTCTPGNTCVYSNPWYSQCLPGSQTTTTSTTSRVIISSTIMASSSGSTRTLTTTVPASTPSNSRLPDPFQFVNGDRVSSKSQWADRRGEISQLFQRYELGTFPPKPSSVAAAFTSNTLTITCSEGGKTITFTASINYPTSGQAPYPAIIGYGGGSLPQPAGVAVINYNNLDLAADSTTRGGGKFYTIYGTGHSAGAMVAWAWGASRIIDALEMVSAANINPKRIGVTGCSRYGKGAFVAGALDERFALTIPQESGCGGSGCWRLAADMKRNGQDVETAPNLASGGTNWMSKNFDVFAQTTVDTLPFDHHMLAGLVAPRGLYVIENLDYLWLGPASDYGCMTTGQLIYQALGVTDSMGFSQIGGHLHCSFDSRQQSELTAFVSRFLLDRSANTAIFRTTGTFGFDKTKWINWSIPSL